MEVVILPSSIRPLFAYWYDIRSANETESQVTQGSRLGVAVMMIQVSASWTGHSLGHLRH